MELLERRKLGLIDVQGPQSYNQEQDKAEAEKNEYWPLEAPSLRLEYLFRVWFLHQTPYSLSQHRQSTKTVVTGLTR